MAAKQDRKTQSITSTDVGSQAPAAATTSDTAIELPPPAVTETTVELPAALLQPETLPGPALEETSIEEPVQEPPAPAPIAPTPRFGPSCPTCGSTAVGIAGGMRHCNQCGASWA
jgi:hypothetical protein